MLGASLPASAWPAHLSPSLFNGLLVRLLGAAGVLLAFVGLSMVRAPAGTWQLLRWLGLARTPHPAGRVAAWGLVVIGLAMAVLSRLLA